MRFVIDYFEGKGMFHFSHAYDFICSLKVIRRIDQQLGQSFKSAQVHANNIIRWINQQESTNIVSSIIFKSALRYSNHHRS